MKPMTFLVAAVLVSCFVVTLGQKTGEEGMVRKTKIDLPDPARQGGMALTESLNLRKSTREFRQQPIELAAISQLLWAGQGITHSDDFRTAPSAGALFPIELYLVADSVDGLDPGVYKYHPQTHTLTEVIKGRKLDDLVGVALWQEWIAGAAAAIIIAAVYERVTGKYGERGVRYTHIEVGCVAQNIGLQAAALHLGSTVVGAFEDQAVSHQLGLAEKERPLVIMPIGRI